MQEFRHLEVSKTETVKKNGLYSLHRESWSINRFGKNKSAPSVVATHYTLCEPPCPSAYRNGPGFSRSRYALAFLCLSPDQANTHSHVFPFRPRLDWVCFGSLRERRGASVCVCSPGDELESLLRNPERELNRKEGALLAYIVCCSDRVMRPSLRERRVGAQILLEWHGSLDVFMAPESGRIGLFSVVGDGSLDLFSIQYSAFEILTGFVCCAQCFTSLGALLSRRCVSSTLSVTLNPLPVSLPQPENFCASLPALPFINRNVCLTKFM